MVILKNIDFGSLFASSGVLGSFGEGYWFHKYYRTAFKGFDFSNSTFVGKTSTLRLEVGNLPLRSNFQPKKYFPKCIRPYFLKGMILNAVALSNPGIVPLVETGQWQQLARPFLLSVAILGKTSLRRIGETKSFCWYLREKLLPDCHAPVGLEINAKCPNIGNGQKESDSEIGVALKEILLVAVSILDAPIVLKIGVDTPIAVIAEIADAGLCDAISLVNAVRWGESSDKIPWRKLFGTDVSPLAKFGGGSLSGAPLVEIAAAKIEELRKKGVKLPIIGGGGIGCRASFKKDIRRFRDAGADAAAIGSAAVVRPFWVRPVIEYAEDVFT